MTRSKSILSLALGLMAACIGGPAAAQSAASFPVRVSANGRHLVDVGGAPFLLSGDTPWSLIVQVTKTEAEQYLENRRQKGMNAVIVNLLEHKFSSSAPNNRAGDGPFTTPGDFSTPNEAYFAHADWVIAKAAEKGILVLLTPCYLGYGGGDQGFWVELNGNTAAKCRGYGQYLGNRYRSFTNIVWVHGGDYNPPSGSTGEQKALEILFGIKDRDTSKLHTYHGSRGRNAYEQANFAPHLDLDAVYTDVITYGKSLEAYNRTGFKPHFVFEAKYENEGPSRASLRAQSWWSNLSGSTGQFFGNSPLWHFNAPTWNSYGWTWQAAMDAAGSQDQARIGPVFTPRAWPALVPDQSHATVTAGYGTSGQMDYVTAGRAGDGTLVMAYLPSTGTGTRTITVNMARLSASADARWVNPASGAASTVSGSPFAHSGSRTFTTPGDNGTGANDWVFVLETASSPPPPPAPAAPSGLAATAVSASRIDLSWTDNATNETGFSLERGSSASGPWTQIATPGPDAASYSNTGLAASTAYTYRVRAVNSGTYSAYSNTASATTLAPPPPPPPPPPGSGAGVTGEYYDDIDFTGFAFVRTDARVDFAWGAGAPAAGMGADGFSVRWTGRLQPLYSQTYTLFTNSDDGVRLRVNGQLLIDNWTDHGPTEDSATIALTAGQLYDFTLEYYDNTGGAVIQLLWSSASQAKGAIPSSQLYVVDTDGDGMADAAEAALGLDPSAGDQDGDGIPDGLNDWDGDGTNNQTEVAAGSAPGLPGGGALPSGGGGGCGATGLEVLLALLLRRSWERRFVSKGN